MKNNKWLKKNKQQKDFKEDFEQFLRDLEDDPEMRSTINLYKDKKAIDELEQKLRGMTINEKTDELKKMGKLENKKKVVRAKRKTEKGKELKKEKEEQDELTKKLLEATKEDDESDFEEDFPAVQLGELMDNLKIEE